jgi:hypothetical protein
MALIKNQNQFSDYLNGAASFALVRQAHKLKKTNIAEQFAQDNTQTKN